MESQKDEKPKSWGVIISCIIIMIFLIIVFWPKPKAKSKWKPVPTQIVYFDSQKRFYKGMDYQEVKQIWLSKGYTIHNAREYNDYDKTGEVTLIFPGGVAFHFYYWGLEDCEGTDNW